MDKLLMFIESHWQVEIAFLIKILLSCSTSHLFFSAQSEVFYNIFKTHEKEYLIDDLNEKVFGDVMKFIYTGQLDIDVNNEEELMRAANKFDIKNLIRNIQLRRNLRNNPLTVKELDNLQVKYEEAKYLYEKSKERLSTRNPFTDPPSRYY